MSKPISINKKNNKIFEFRGRPIVLVCATEHYGAVMNRPFNYKKYLLDAYKKKQTLTRLFVLFRELQNHINPYSTCKPESPDYISPFVRSGPGVALDGQLKYDLDRWNPEFFDRLHDFLATASKYGIIVEITLLSNTYGSQVWDLNPLNSKNNINDLDEIRWMEYNTLRHKKLFDRQVAHVTKIVKETNKYDNIIYEICNEPGGKFPGSGDNPTIEEINNWQRAIAKVIRETEANLPKKHLISGQESFIYEPFEQLTDMSFDELDVDIVNIHPLPNTKYQGKSYDMGAFMSKELKLKEVRDFCLATLYEKKPLNLDEDNVATQYKDIDGWTIQRKRAWTALFCASHYDFIDFSINNYIETGTKESQKYIRTWISYLSEFIHSLNLEKIRPILKSVTKKPLHTVESVMQDEDGQTYIYIADRREIKDKGYGTKISGEIGIKLPCREYKICFYSPTKGVYSPYVLSKGGNSTSILLPEFKHDIVICITNK